MEMFSINKSIPEQVAPEQLLRGSWRKKRVISIWCYDFIQFMVFIALKENSIKQRVLIYVHIKIF